MYNNNMYYYYNFQLYKNHSMWKKPRYDEDQQDNVFVTLNDSKRWLLTATYLQTPQLWLQYLRIW